LGAAAAAAKGPNNLFEEIESRIAKEPVKLNVVVQLAEEGDGVNDATVPWPEDRKLVKLGQLAFTGLVATELMNRRTLYSSRFPGWTA
jgi:catalase